MNDFSDMAAVPVSSKSAAAERILAGELPIAVSNRWKPLRMGLMNLFLFDDERFPFADGWLLLRGINGTGKSRVLAMTLPLLLDGSFRPNRVEPDRDPNRDVSWNLLMDDQDHRTGYSWIEFGRQEPQPSHEGNGHIAGDRYLTLGCGMKAVRGQPIKPWFFVTELRIDESLRLVSPDGVPLTQRQLSDAIGERGQVVDTAREHRRLVDEKLFRLGERYEPLIDLLLQLRQPKLAKTLELDQLESALRSALPPLSETLLDDAAEAFRDLDQYRAQLAADRRLLDDVKKFLQPYRSHVQRGVLRCSKQLTKANSEYERAGREQRQATEDIASKQSLVDSQKQRFGECQLQQASAEAAVNALQNRPEMQDASRLNQLRSSINRQSLEIDELEGDLRCEDEEYRAAELGKQEAERHYAASCRSAVTAADSAAQAAAPDALADRHRELAAQLLADGDESQASSIQDELSGEIKHFRQLADHLATLNQAIAEEEGHLRNATRETANAKAELERANEELDDTTQRETDARETLWQSIVQWRQVASPLDAHLSPPGSLRDTWFEWAEALDGPDPLSLDIMRAEQLAERDHAGLEATLMKQLDELGRRDGELAFEQQRLEAGAVIEPPAPYTRDAVARASRQAGAPLWRLIDFAPEVPPAERANWEAALEAAGILDAWVTPAGNLFDSQQHDVLLLPDDAPPLPSERQLRRVLVPADCSAKFGVPAEVVEQLLTIVGVGAGAGSVWVDHDGCWQNGPLRGCWTKSRAQFIGEDAQAQWRAVRLREIASLRADIATALSQAKVQVEEVAELRAAVIAQRERLPSADLLRQHRATTEAKQSQVDRAGVNHRECEERESAHRQEAARLSEARNQDAFDMGLADWSDRVEEFRQNLNDYEVKLHLFWASLDGITTARLRAADAEVRFHRSAGRAKDLRARLYRKQLELAKEDAEFRELEATAGQVVAKILERLELKRKEKLRLDGEIEVCRTQIGERGMEIAVLESQLKLLDDSLRQSDRARRDAAEWFGTLGTLGLVAFAAGDLELPEQPWSMTQAIKLSRECDARMATVGIDDEAWQRSQNRVYQEHNSLQQSILSQEGMNTDVDHLRDGLQLVSITLYGNQASPASAVARLESEVAQREQILDEKEQETLEKYLLGEVADGLRQKMRAAAELVELMTSEVSRRPMKTGMQLRFRWQLNPEGPAGVAEASTVLQTASATWSPEEREQIKQFLARRIREQRDSDIAAPWREHLREALDYRTWFRIEISRRSGPDADWKKLTRRTYGSGSGGEKAIALTLPQVAAAAAYYKTADSAAPRFILLDEAFAGISLDMRESCLELIAAFDLDVVMTSENEWGCYPSVPQLAICQLDRFAGINAVVNRVFVWNGKHKREAVVPELSAEKERQPLLKD